MNNFAMNHESLSSTDFQVPEELPVQPGTVDHGREYEIKIVALLGLRCIRHKDIENMWIGSNVADCGAFDDVVLHIETTKKKRITYLVQLKHKEDDTNNVKSSEFKKGDFSIIKYYDTVKEIKNKIDNQGDTSSTIISHLRNNQERIVFILYTNRGTTDNDFLINVKKTSSIDKEWLLFTMLNTENGCVSEFDYQKINIKEFTLESDYKSLMEKFFLFTKQTNVSKIDNLIMNELSGFIGDLTLFKQTTAEVLDQYIQFVTDWYKGKLGGRYPLTKDLIYKVLLASIITPYRREIQISSNHFNYDIWNDFIMEKSLTVIEEDALVYDFVIGCIVKASTSYCDKNENKVLWKRHPDKLNRSVLKTVNRSKEVKPLEAYEFLWKTKEIPVLLNADTKQELKSLIELISLFPNTYIVIIISKIPFQLQDVNFKLCDLNSLVTGLHNFDDQQVQRILKCLVTLQSRESVKLSQFLTKKDLHYISMKDIIYILSEKFSIGNEFASLPDLFIERTLEAVWLIPEVLVENKNEVFLIKHNQDDDLTFSFFLREVKIDESEINNNGDIEYKTSRIIRIKADSSIKEIEKCYNMKNKNFHYLILHKGKYLQWIRSYGSVKNIRDYRKRSHLSNYELNFKNPVLTACSNKTTLISACPGMGKSLLLDYISTNVSLNMWVLKVNLYQYSNNYDEDNFENLNAEECLRHFFTESMLKTQNNDLAIFIFEKLLESKKIIVLFDGFDEVPESLRDEVLKMIKVISKSDYYICITTRPNLKSYLEKELDTFGITINPFSNVEQTTYLTQFFLSRCGEEHLQTISKFVGKLLDSAKENLSDQDEEFTGIPLQTMLLTEVFMDDCKYFIVNQHFKCNNFDLVYLYKHFINGKIQIVCKKFGSNSRDTFRRYKKYRSLYALKLLFTTEDLKGFKVEEQLNQVIESFGIEDFLNDIQKDGIVFVQNETNVVFVHRTFAEYLAAEWLASNINYKNQTLIKELFKKLFYSSFTTVRNIFDRILAENCPLHLAIINRQVAATTMLLTSNPNHLLDVDKGNRTVIHLMASWGIHHPFHLESEGIERLRKMISKDPMKEIIQLLPDGKIISSQDTLLDCTPLDYALQSGCLNMADAICARLERFDDCLTVNDANLFSYLRVYLREFPYGSLGSVLIKHSITKELMNILNEKLLRNDEKDELHNAIMQGNIKEVSLLLCSEENINKIDCHGFSYLHKAVIVGDAIMTQLLVTNNIDINLKDTTGKTSLHWATIKSNLDIISLLLSINADVNVVDNNSMSALHYAIVANVDKRHQIVSALLQNGADITLNDNYGKTVLHYALHYNQIDIFQLLLKFGVNINENTDDRESDNLLDILSSKDSDGGTILHWAADKGFSDIVGLILSYGANTEIMDDDGNTPLHWAAQNGHLNVITALLFHKVNINVRNSVGTTALHVAVREGNCDLVKLLLANGADTEAMRATSQTPLHIASYEGYSDIVKLLLLHGANIEALDNFNNTPLIIATRYANDDVVEILLSNKANMQATFTANLTCLHAASVEGSCDIVRALLLQGANIEALDDYNRTPLLCASENGHVEIVEMLLSNGADIKARNKNKQTSLHVASLLGHFKTIKILLLHGVDTEALDKYGRTALFCASDKGRVDAVETLLLNGANIEARDESSMTCLFVATLSGRLDTVKILLSHGANIEALDNHSRTSLICASEKGYIDIVEILLSVGANIKVKDEKNQTCLHVPCTDGLFDIVKILLLHGADTEVFNSFNKSPTMLACYNGHVDIVDILLSHGANVEATHTDNLTCLHAACFGGHCNVVKTLLLHGANAEVVLNDNRTPLLCASQVGYTDIVEALLSHGVNIEAKDKNGETSLHVASLLGQFDTVKTLLLQGANMEALDNYSRTPLICASEKGHVNMVEILLANGANVEAKNIDNETCLHVACSGGHCNIVEILLLHGANIEALDNYNRTPLLCAALEGHVDVFETLLSNGANLNL